MLRYLFNDGHRSMVHKGRKKSPGPSKDLGIHVSWLEEESHAQLHHALSGFAVDAAEHRRVGIGDDVSEKSDG